MDRYKLLSWAAVVLSAVLLVLPRIIPICTGLAGGTDPMQCHYAFQAEFLITLLALIFSGSLLVLRTYEARLLAGFTVLLLGIVVIVLPQPWAVGICQHGGACHRTTFFVTIGGGLLALAGALTALLAHKDGQGEAK